jgi:uncharacterized protein (DUF4415 family)
MKKHTTTAKRGRVDLARVDATTEAEIEAQAREDGEDLAEWTPEMLRRAKSFQARPKERITVRLDADVLDRLRAEGPGYQSRINAILRSYYSHR